MKDLLTFSTVIIMLGVTVVGLVVLTRRSQCNYSLRYRTRNEIADDRRRGMRRCKGFAARGGLVVSWLALAVTAAAGMSYW